MLQGKKILLAITGSIAAYKSIYLVRLLVKAGAEVKIILTPAAKDFVPVLTLSTLSKNKVLSQLSDESTWANHVMLGRWADVMIVAPASCNTLAKMVNGHCDNLVLAAYLSATCPVAIAPAMDEDMWRHAATQNNIEKLKSFGHSIIPVGDGELASGLHGEGRMAEPEDIVMFLIEHYFRGNRLSGKNVMVTAGPTYEAIDPVRFIGNHSSGKMGTALAEALYVAGAHVTLVCGPVYKKSKYKAITTIDVVSAEEMFVACINNFAEMDVVVMAAAVADYAPEAIAPEKIKKKDSRLSIELKKTNDILSHLGNIKSAKQVLVGFALETENEHENAVKKLKSKNADMIVLNSLRDEKAGFGKNTNKVTIFEKEGKITSFDTKSKPDVAKDIIEIIINKLNEKK
jgi:phosphopantothenoylcysteine decarboxylase / phosphopantothenate---cysteine ligase